MSQWIWSQSDLIKLAEYKKPEVRRWACERMRTLYGEAGIEILERLLRDRDKDVSLEAFKYLENYLNPRFKDTLLKMYETKTGVIAGKCALLLGKLKDERFISAYKKKINTKTIQFDEVIWSIKPIGELATPQARNILREMLSEIEREVDPFFIHALIHALIKAKEDLSTILECYTRHYKRYAMEILYPLTSICGSWYSIADLQQEGERKIFKKSLPRVILESLSYLKEKRLPSLEEALRNAFKKQNCRQVIEIVWNYVKKTVDENGYRESEVSLLRNDSPPIVNYQILKAFKDFLIRGQEDSLKEIAIVALIILSRFIEFRSLFGLRVEELDDEKLFEILFEDRGTLEIDDRMMERLLTICHPETIFDHSIGQLKDHPSFYGTGRAIQLLGRLKDERAIPDLVDFFKRKGNDEALDQCIKALAGIGSPLIDYLEKNFDQLNRDQQSEILFALEDIPEERTADLLLRYWDKLWSMDKEPFLYALEKVASKRFIEPLRKELKEGEVLEEEIFYLLCHIHGVDDILLPQIEKKMVEREKEIEGRLDVLERGDLNGLLNKTVEVELKCRQCGKSYYYDIENIYVIPGEKEEPGISDKIVCKNCRAINQYEMTTKGRLAILSQLVLMTGLSEKRKLKPEESPIKFAKAGLMDGRLMSFDDVLKYYKKEVQKAPDDPALRVGYGNVLLKMGMEGEAILQYQEALRLDPLAIEAYASLGEYEGDKGNFSQAYEYFSKAADRVHTGHYYRTKEIDQLKEAIFLNLEHYEEVLGKGREQAPVPSSQRLIKKEKVGRNDPCPCGSGKKYKKCCLNKDESKRSEKTSATPKEIELRDRLVSFSAKERYKKDFEKAYYLYWRRPFREDLIMDEEGEINFGFFLDWFIHDFTLRNGMTVIEEFYQERKEKLSEEEVSLLKYEMASHLSIYEVVSVTPEVGLRLKDLLINEEMDILEVKGSLMLVKWDVIFARVIKMGSVNKLSGMITLIPRRNREEILSSIQRTWEKVKKETGRMEWSDFMKSNAQLIHHLIEDRSVKEPIFVTEEHNKIVSSKAVYEVKDFNSIRYRLSKEFDFITDIEKEGKEIQWTWLKRGKSKDWEGGEPVEGSVILRSEMIRGKGELRWTSLGTVTLIPKRLELWCLSKERLERGKRRLQEILGDDITYRLDTYEDMVKKAMEGSGKTSSIEEGEWPEKYETIFSTIMGELVTKWVDQKIPALDGKTPREAVKNPEGREKVKELLKDWENTEERKRRDGEPYIDINVLRQMLNL